MGHGGQALKGSPGETVQGALAQPPEPRREEVFLDFRGGPGHLQGPQCAGEPLGRDRQTPPWKVGERCTGEKLPSHNDHERIHRKKVTTKVREDSSAEL